MSKQCCNKQHHYIPSESCTQSFGGNNFCFVTYTTSINQVKNPQPHSQDPPRVRKSIHYLNYGTKVLYSNSAVRLIKSENKITLSTLMKRMPARVYTVENFQLLARKVQNYNLLKVMRSKRKYKLSAYWEKSDLYVFSLRWPEPIICVLVMFLICVFQN